MVQNLYVLFFKTIERLKNIIIEKVQILTFLLFDNYTEPPEFKVAFAFNLRSVWSNHLPMPSPESTCNAESKPDLQFLKS